MAKKLSVSKKKLDGICKKYDDVTLNYEDFEVKVHPYLSFSRCESLIRFAADSLSGAVNPRSAFDVAFAVAELTYFTNLNFDTLKLDLDDIQNLMLNSTLFEDIEANVKNTISELKSQAYQLVISEYEKRKTPSVEMIFKDFLAKAEAKLDGLDVGALLSTAKDIAAKDEYAIAEGVLNG